MASSSDNPGGVPKIMQPGRSDQYIGIVDHGDRPLGLPGDSLDVFPPSRQALQMLTRKPFGPVHDVLRHSVHGMPSTGRFTTARGAPWLGRGSTSA